MRILPPYFKITLQEFVLSLLFNNANEKGVIVSSIVSILAVLVARQVDMAWPWYAPIGTLFFLVSGVVTSAFWGEVSTEQQKFYQQQRSLFEKPSAAHYGLLLFAAASILACAVLPNWLYNALS